MTNDRLVKNKQPKDLISQMNKIKILIKENMILFLIKEGTNY